MKPPANGGSWADALSPFPSVHDGPREGHLIIGSPRQSEASRRSDGSIDYSHYAREAERLHRESGARTMQVVLAIARRALAPLRHATSKRTRGS